mgnify:CR=1 FL=1
MHNPYILLNVHIPGGTSKSRGYQAILFWYKKNCYIYGNKSILWIFPDNRRGQAALPPVVISQRFCNKPCRNHNPTDACIHKAHYYFDTKKTVTYTGTKASYEYNGSKVSLGNLTGILTDNGVALGPYYELFVRGLGISYKKDSAKNTLTFSKDGNPIISEKSVIFVSENLIYL